MLSERQFVYDFYLIHCIPIYASAAACSSFAGYEHFMSALGPSNGGRLSLMFKTRALFTCTNKQQLKFSHDVENNIFVTSLPDYPSKLLKPPAHGHTRTHKSSFNNIAYTSALRLLALLELQTRVCTRAFCPR